MPVRVAGAAQPSATVRARRCQSRCWRVRALAVCLVSAGRDGSCVAPAPRSGLSVPSLTAASPRRGAPPCGGPVFAHTDWLGTDILPDNKPLWTVDAAQCCEACANHTTSGTAPCLFWSRFTEERGRCYLKTTATDRHSNPAMEAGSMPGAPSPPVKPPGPAPAPPAPPSPPAPPQTFSVDLGSPPRPFHKPFLECVGSSHMAMGLLAANSASAPGTAAGKGQQARVGKLWREHLKLVTTGPPMCAFAPHSRR